MKKTSKRITRVTRPEFAVMVCLLIIFGVASWGFVEFGRALAETSVAGDPDFPGFKPLGRSMYQTPPALKR